MAMLTAMYRIPFARPVRVQVDEAAALSFEADVNGFRVGVLLHKPEYGPGIRPAGDLPVFFPEDFSVSVSREEEEPPVIVQLGGGRDLTARREWFEERIEEYKRVAILVANRLIGYFKYEKQAPKLRPVSEHDSAFDNADWRNERGEALETGVVAATLNFRSYSGPSLLGEGSFRAEDTPELLAALSPGAAEPSPAREFLSDAQTAVLERNLRRAVMELAIACEVAIKRAFFEEATPAGAAFDYFEDKRRVTIRAIEMIDGPAQEAFGESFKTAHRGHYESLEYLFRCRNKVAHRAVAEYRDNSGVIQNVDRRTLETWWAAVEGLFGWLETKTGKKP